MPLRLSALEVLEEDVESLALFTVVSNDDTAAADNLSGVALSVDLAETGPGSQGLGVRDLEEVDLVLVAQSLDELDVLLLRASLDQDTEVSLSSVQGLGALSQTSGETIVHKRLLENLWVTRMGFGTIIAKPDTEEKIVSQDHPSLRSTAAIKEGITTHLLESVLDAHGTLGGRGFGLLGGDFFDLLDLLGLFFGVRHVGSSFVAFTKIGMLSRGSDLG